jgi:hypothetical protein
MPRYLMSNIGLRQQVRARLADIVRLIEYDDAILAHLLGHLIRDLWI